MAKMTISQLEAQTNDKFAAIEERLQMLIDLAQNSANSNGGKTDKPKRERDWLSKFPAKYDVDGEARNAQREQYAKLAEYARSKYAERREQLGDAVTAFIPVPKRCDIMPHTIQWSECPKLD